MSVTVLETSVLTGAVAVRAWDDVLGRPTETPCTVTALRAADQVAVAQAVPHVSGLYGILRLAPGDYDLLVVPLAATFLPTRLRITVPPGASTIKVDAHLRPSPFYFPPPHSVVLRGTLAFDPIPRRPARWAGIFASLGTGPVVVARSNAHGDFVVILQAPEPDSDGNITLQDATLEIHAATPGAALADDDFSDLPRDDGSLSDLKSRQPLRDTLTESSLGAGSAESLNSPHGPDWIVLLT